MLKNKVEEWFSKNKDAMIADLEKLVKISSVSQKTDGEHVYGEACAQVLEEMLKLGADNGFAVENADYYGGKISFDSGEKTIGLWGHLDIVPHGDDWIYPKYEMTNTGEFLIGRGVADNKGACIQNLYAMKCMRELGFAPKNNITLFVGCAEETGMDDISYITDKFGYPDISIVTDSVFPVCNGEKGIFSGTLVCDKISDEVLDINAGLVSNALPGTAYITLNKSVDSLPKLPESIKVEDLGGKTKLSAEGLACHAASPEKGVNAIAVLLAPLLENGVFNENDAPYFEFLCKLCGTYDGSAVEIAYEDKESGPLTCAACVARKTEDAITISLNIRYSVTIDDEAMIASIVKISGENGFELTQAENSKPYYLPEDTWFIKSMLDIYREITGDEANCYTMGGGTYARKLKNAVVFGPEMETDYSALNLPVGHGSAHMPDEVVKIENFLKAAVIYTLSLIELDKQL